MKKGQTILGNAYVLQIKDMHNKTAAAAVCRSLRQAVQTAGEYVTDMANYSKVYREFTVMRGAYAGVFFAKYKDDPELLVALGRKPSKHLFVLINQTFLHPTELQFKASKDGSFDEPAAGTFLGDVEELLTE